MSLEALAQLLMSAEPRGEEHVGAPAEDWRLDIERLAGADVVVWGRPPDPRALGPRALRSAYARETALRGLARSAPSPLRLAAVHRWRPGFYRAPALTPLARWLRAGAIAELSTPGRPLRRIDLAARAAGATRQGPALRPASGGAALLPVELPGGRNWVLRAGGVHTPGDPRGAAAALERLHGLSDRIPVPGGHGITAGVSWALESLVPGRPPSRLTSRLARDVVAVCVRLPRGAGAPAAQRDDLEAIAALVPDRARELLALASELDRAVAGLPAVARHGDLWAGNLLVERGRLTGVVDWDAWHPAAVPGGDLLQLWTGERVVRGVSLGEAWRDRPWLAQRFRALSDPYWRALEVDPGPEMLSAVGLAWWASQVAASLGRSPELAVDERWVDRNVSVVLDAVDVTWR